MRFDDNSRRSYTILKINVWNTEKKHWNFLIFQISSTRHVLHLKSFLQIWFTRLTCYTGSPRTENEACEPTGQYRGDSSSLRCTRRVPQGETYVYFPRVSYFCFLLFLSFLFHFFLQSVLLLLKNGTDPSIKNNKLETPLHLSARYSRHIKQQGYS